MDRWGPIGDRPWSKITYNLYDINIGPGPSWPEKIFGPGPGWS